jgi:hypothetical protein
MDILVDLLLILSVAKILHLDTVIKCNDILNPNFNNHHNNKSPDNSWSTTIANKENKTSEISSFYLNCHIKKNKTIKHEGFVPWATQGCRITYTKIGLVN